MVQKLSILRQIQAVSHHHAPLQPPQYRSPLIVGKINPSGLFQHLINMSKALLICKQLLLLRLNHRTIFGIVKDFPRNILRRQHVIHQAGADGALWHPVKFGADRTLYNGQPPFFLYGLNPVGAVGAGSGENHGDGMFLLLLSQGVEENVDRVV